LDHANIVGTITNGKSHRSDSILHEQHNQGLLKRRYTATDDTLAQHGESKNEVFTPFIGKNLTSKVLDRKKERIS